MKILKVLLMIGKKFAFRKSKSIQGAADENILNQIMHTAEFLIRW